MEVYVDSEVDEIKSTESEEKVQQSWSYIDQKQENRKPDVEDNKSDVKVMLTEKKSISFARGRSKAIRSDSVECRHISDNDE